MVQDPEERASRAVSAECSSAFPWLIIQILANRLSQENERDHPIHPIRAPLMVLCNWG
jgi:hypothetical protein